MLMDVAKTGSVVVMLANRHNSSQKAVLGILAIVMAITFCEHAACMDTTTC